MHGAGVRYSEDETLPVGQTIHVTSKLNPLRLLMTKPLSLNGRLAKWAISLSQYEMQFLLQKAVKGQVVAGFLAEHPDPSTTKLYGDLPDEIAEVCMPRRLSKNRCGNSSSMVHQERVIEEIS